jgi:hypothetical protein
MNGKCALLTVLITGCGTLVAQTTPTEPTTPGSFGHIRLYPIAPPKSPASKLIVTTVKPAVAPGDPLVDTTGQIPEFGGLLQAYGNTNHLNQQDTTKQPFGGEVTLPLANRWELFSGFAGTYVQFGSPNAVPNTWLTQAKTGARVAVDPERHVWVGVTSYYQTNFAGEKTRTHITKAADLTFRWGK